jgi:hypothetical protein
MSSLNWITKLPKHKILFDPKTHRMAHAVYRMEDIEDVKVTRKTSECIKDFLAYGAVKLTRTSFDLLTRYNPEKMTERDWVNRAIFLETVAGVPGMIGGMMRHLKSLRTLERDNGWIHHLLQEAENERMHLFFFLQLRHPGILGRLAIAVAQGVFFNSYFLAYMISPSFCHRFVGYLEEEAVHTYTKLIESLDEGRLPHFEKMSAPAEAIEYYSLPADAKMRDLFLSIRADESFHREVNHHFADTPTYEPFDA